MRLSVTDPDLVVLRKAVATLADALAANPDRTATENEDLRRLTRLHRSLRR